MRVAIAGFALESVSFLPNETTLTEFKAAETAGGALLDALRGTNTTMGGFIAVCEREGIEIVPIVHTEGGAAGPASDEAFEHYASAICRGLKEVSGSIDGVLLSLHGALTTPTRLDADAEIVERVRAVVGPSLPVMVGLDYHGNLDERILRSATAICGYHYSPHIDKAETGERTARCMVRTLRGEIRPVCTIVKPGVMVPSIFSATSLSPLASIVAESIELPKRTPRLVDVSVFAGFSYADVPNCGFSVVTIADGDRDLAERTARTLADKVRRLRRELHKKEMVSELESGVARAIAKAKTAKKPIVLLEHADRLNDSTYVLRELIRQGARGVAVPFLWDPKAAATAVAAGEGATVRLEVGGHSSARAGGPVTIEGKVRFAGEKEFLVGGPMNHGSLIRLGPTAVIDTGNIVISITTVPHTAIDEDAFVQFGMRAADFAIIVLRSKTHFRAVYEPISEEIVIIDTPDWGPADLTTLPYRHVPLATTYPFADGA
jgi:microcystin degradation protein MlrC